jgi:hypothetical protein
MGNRGAVVALFTFASHLLAFFANRRVASEPDDSEAMVDLVHSRLRLYETSFSTYERVYHRSRRTTDAENLEHLCPVFHCFPDSYQTTVTCLVLVKEDSET